MEAGAIKNLLPLKIYWYTAAVLIHSLPAKMDSFFMSPTLPRVFYLEKMHSTQRQPILYTFSFDRSKEAEKFSFSHLYCSQCLHHSDILSIMVVL